MEKERQEEKRVVIFPVREIDWMDMELVPKFEKMRINFMDSRDKQVRWQRRFSIWVGAG